VAKAPELVLVSALAWCFFLAGVAQAIGLSREMGALIAGVSLSTFPYNLDVMAKAVSLRDFFVTLFFVALGMQITVPSLQVLELALGASVFVIVSRVVVVPILFIPLFFAVIRSLSERGLVRRSAGAVVPPTVAVAAEGD